MMEQTKFKDWKVNRIFLATGYLRAANYIIDSIISFLICRVIYTALLYIEARFNYFYILIISWFLYYFLSETIFQRTLGKLITKTKIVDYQGHKPSIKKVLIRTIVRLIPIDFLMFDREYYGCWHDSLSKTTVVNSENFDAAQELKSSFDEIGKLEN